MEIQKFKKKFQASVLTSGPLSASPSAKEN
jgi:hypothetical protein